MIDIEQRLKVRIHVDRVAFESPNTTTGEALYELGHVEKHRELFRETGGDHEDEFVPRDGHGVQLKEDEHFYSQKATTIIVNADPKDVVETRLTFADVVKLAFPVPPKGGNIIFTVVYRKGPPESSKGTLLEGQSVRVKKGMIFDVTSTDRS